MTAPVKDHTRSGFEMPEGSANADNDLIKTPLVDTNSDDERNVVTGTPPAGQEESGDGGLGEGLGEGAGKK